MKLRCFKLTPELSDFLASAHQIGLEFLELLLLAEHDLEPGGTIDFIDLTLICEAPKIGPHRAAIRASIATLLRLPESRISIKATTTERLGFTGRGEGMAAQAIATIRIAETDT